MERADDSRSIPSARAADSTGRMEGVYAGLLGLGVILPFSRFVPWLLDHGLDVGRFFDDLFANRIGGFFGLDVFVAAGTLLVLAAVDRELRPRQRWLVAGGSLLGASVGLPLYLLIRERNRRRTMDGPWGASVTVPGASRRR